MTCETAERKSVMALPLGGFAECTSTTAQKVPKPIHGK
jgi:hypothetical protein